MSSIAGVAGTSATDLTGATQAEFKDNVFLKLLVAELKTQSPLEPVDNQSFMQQMATFSSMEQTREMNDSLLQLLQFQGLLARMQGLEKAGALLGREVDFKLESGEEGSGEVQGALVEDGDILLDLGDRKVPLSSVVGIRSVDQPAGSGSGK